MKTAIFLSAAVFTAAAVAAPPAKPAAPAQAATKAAPVAPKVQLQEVTYEDLPKYLNKVIVVRTTLHTERSGTLVKVSGTAIDLKLDSGATLGLPRDTIHSIGVPIGPPDPLFPDKSDAGAKKN